MNELTTIPFETIHGDTAQLADFGGKVLLVVNVASKCGSTPQYADLEALYEKYNSEGLEVIGFPANNFGEQEPGTNEEILEFCTSNYGVTFPMMAKISVLGDDIHPLYRYLTTHVDPPGDIEWNFHKFLIDRTGEIVGRYNRRTPPNDPTFITEVEKLLNEK